MNLHMPNVTSEITYSSSWVTEHLEMVLVQRVLKNNACAFSDQVSYLCNEQVFREFIKELSGPTWLGELNIQQVPYSMAERIEGFLYSNTFNAYAKFLVKNQVVEVVFYGGAEGVNFLHEIFDSRFSPIRCFVNWVYNTDGDKSKFPVRTDRAPRDVLYPFLDSRCSLSHYYEQFARSDSNILLLVGPPGTGKTSFIVGLVNHIGTDVTLAFGQSIMERDNFYADFMSSSSSGIVIVEDADSLLGSRRDGNTIMHNFLNLGDGVISNRDKKIVFSTNLPNLSSIDPALLRPGRCFDIVRFDSYDAVRARAVVAELGIPAPAAGIEDGKRYTLAELFNSGEQESRGYHEPDRVINGFGFAPPVR